MSYTDLTDSEIGEGEPIDFRLLQAMRDTTLAAGATAVLNGGDCTAFPGGFASPNVSSATTSSSALLLDNNNGWFGFYFSERLIDAAREGGCTIQAGFNEIVSDMTPISAGGGSQVGFSYSLYAAHVTQSITGDDALGGRNTISSPVVSFDAGNVTDGTVVTSTDITLTCKIEAADIPSSPGFVKAYVIVTCNYVNLDATAHEAGFSTSNTRSDFALIID